MEFRILHPSGRVRHVRSTARAVHGSGGAVQAYIGSVDDVTSRKQSEYALALERQRLENTLDGTQLATWEWEVETGALLLNTRWAHMLGYRLDELGNTSTNTWASHTHPEDWEKIPRMLEWHLQGHSEKFEAEIRVRHRDGHWIWVLDVGKVMAGQTGLRPRAVFGTRQDITLRKRQEEALRKSQDFLERSGWMAGVGGWEVDLLQGTVFWSPETCRIHGVDPGHQPTLEEAINYYAPEARPVVQRAVQRAMEASEDWDLELPVIRADGQKIWARAVGSAQWVDGKAVRLVGAFQDVTQRVNERLALQEAKERITLATESGEIGVWQWNIASGELVWDDRMFQLYGLTRPEGVAAYALWSRALHPDDVAAAEAALQHSIETGAAFNTEFRVHWPNGAQRHLRGSGLVHRDEEGRAISMVGVNWDITEPRTLAAALADQRELLAVTLRSIGDAVITTDAQGRVTWLNPVAEQLTGWSSTEAQTQPLETVFHIVHEDTREVAVNPVTSCLEQGKVVGLANHTVLISRSGHEYGIEDSAAPIRNAQGQVLGVVLVFHDVTEQRRISGEISHRASHDALTELVNRREFESRLQRLLDKTGEDRGEHALLFMDLDQFKIVNDTCGHAAGDELLRQISKLLQETVRHRDTVARLGGDEFAVILEHCKSDQAQRVAQQLCDRVNDFRYVHGERRFRVGASIGLVPLTSHFTTAAMAMQAADASCYAAKEAGRNRVHAWYDSDETRLARDSQVQWTTRIEQALDDNLFELFAQRIDSLGEPGTGLHAEVLLRMRGSDGVLIPPGSFLPAAERFHLASRIDRWVLRHSVAWLCSIPVLSLIDNLSVNLSGQSVGDRSFHQWALHMLADAGPDICRRLCLEITETAAITQLADAGQFIEKLRELGVKTALDDFGAGASSFGYLKSMPVDYLKIDGQFVRDLVTDPLDEAAVRCFIDVAKVVNMKTVAEFVDNPEVLQRLREMGADYAQGFLLHRPEPIKHLLD
jgi:diguanylate cyclase (GGDEF)-like protein/PAS domain S-box-containing protein